VFKKTQEIEEERVEFNTHTHTIKLKGQNYVFHSSHKHYFLAKLEFLFYYLFREPWEVLQEDVQANVSCVLPIHNDAKYLRYSMPTLLKSSFKEIVVVLDRCSNGSEDLIQKFGDDRFKVVLKNNTLWKNSCAEAKNIGCSKANSPLIFHCDADIILDLEALEKAKSLLRRHSKLNAVTFSYRQYTLDGSFFERIRNEWTNLMASISRKTGIQPGHSGIYLIRKEWANLSDHFSEYDLTQKKVNFVQIETDTLHLRPGYSKTKQFIRGKTRVALRQYGILKMLLSTILGLQPYMLVSYLKELSK